MSGRPWTEEDLALLAAHPDWPAVRLAEILDRGVSSIQHKRRAVAKGLVPSYEFWAPAEDEVLLEHRWWSAAQLVRLLPGRTETAIVRRRVFLGLPGAKGRHHLPQTVGARPLLAKTCMTCGRLLQAEWFRFIARRHCWSSPCRKCDRSTQDESARPPRTDRHHARKDAVTRPYAHRLHRHYVEADHEVLRDPDLTAYQKALRLGRTYGAAVSACRRFGYPSHKGLGEPTDEWRIYNPNAPEVAA